MAAATYSTLPTSAYAGFGSEGDPYHTNNAGTGIRTIPSNSYQYQTDDQQQSPYSNGGYNTQQPQSVPPSTYAQQPPNNQQQQPYYSNEYQQPPYSNDVHSTQQPQSVPPSTYAQQLPNNQQQQPYYPDEYQQPQYSNDVHSAQQPQKVLPNTYPRQLPNNQQQQPYYPNEYQQPPYSNDVHSTQQPQNVPLNTYPQQLPDNQQQQPFYSNGYQQSPYSNSDDYSTLQSQTVPPHKYASNSANNQQQFNGYPNSQIPKTNNRLIPTTNNNNTEIYPDMNAIQPPHKKNMDNHFVDPRNYQQTSYIGTTQRMPSTPIDNQYHQSPPERQMSNHPPKQEQQLYHKLQSPSQSVHRISKPPICGPAIHRRSPSNDNDNVSLETVSKTNNSRRESKASKSSFMRGASLKRNEEIHREKPKDQQALSNESKTPKSKSQNASSQTDEPSDLEKTKPNKKQTDSQSEIKKAPPAYGKQNDIGTTNHTKRQPHVQSKLHKNHRNDYQTDDDYSTDDDDNSACPRCKFRKRTIFSDTKLDKNPRLPPLRQGRKLSHHDPYINAPLPSRRPLQRRFSIDDPPPPGLQSNRHGRHHIHRDTGKIPSYRDPYDPSFDHRNRNTKPNRRNDKINPYFDREDNRSGMNRDDGHRSRIGKNKHANLNDPLGRKSRHGPEEYVRSQRPPLRYSPDYYDERDTHDNWRQEKKEHSKTKFQPNAHGTSSQLAFRSDSYAENEHRRALRDSQGYYFPYKQYTLKDYNNLKKTFKINPYSDRSDSPLDRKEMARKRQEYGTAIEKHTIDSPEIRPKEMPPVKPWHLATGGLHDPDAASKRERALEYAKVQVQKYQTLTLISNHSDRSDSEQSGSRPFAKMNDDRSHLRICSICNGPCTKQNQNLRNT